MTRAARRAHMRSRLERAHSIRRVPLGERAGHLFRQVYKLVSNKPPYDDVLNRVYGERSLMNPLLYPPGRREQLRREMQLRHERTGTW